MLIQDWKSCVRPAALLESVGLNYWKLPAGASSSGVASVAKIPPMPPSCAARSPGPPPASSRAHIVVWTGAFMGD